MNVRRFLEHRFLCWGIAAWVAASCLPASAQGNLGLKVRVGLGRGPSEYRQNPVFLTLTPPPDPGTPVAITVTLLASESSLAGWSSSDPSRARIPLSHYRFQRAYPGPDQALAVPVPLKEEVLRLRVAVETGDGRRATRTVNRPEFGWRVTLVLTRRREALSFLADMLGAVIVSDPKDLPADWRCYQSVSTLMVDDFRLDELPPATLAALEKAVSSHLGVLVTGPGLEANAGARLLGPLAKVGARGWGPASPQPELAQWLSAWVENVNDLQPLPLLQLDNAEDMTLVRSGGQPAVLRVQGARGFVAACAFDPARLSWDDPNASYKARANACGHLLNLATPGPGVSVSPARVVESLVPREAQMSGMTVPIIILLGIFALALGPVNFLVVRRARRREWMLVTVPVMVAVFLAATVIVSRASFGREDVFSTQTAILASADRDQAVELTQFGRLSRRQEPISFLLPEGALAAGPREPAEERSPTQLEFRPLSWDEPGDGTLSLSNVWQRPRSMRFCGAERIVALRPPVAEAHLEGDELVGSFTNTFDYTLENAVLMVKWRHADLGKIAPGETKTFRVKLGTPEKYTNPNETPIQYLWPSVWIERLSGKSVTPDSPPRELQWVMDALPGQDLEAPTLLAWGGPQAPAASPGAARRDMRLTAVRIPVTPLQGERVKIPAGIAVLLRNSGGAMLPLSAFSSNERNKPIYVYQLPLAPGELADCTLTVHFHVSSPRWLKGATGPPLSLLDWQKKRWERITDGATGTGELRLRHGSRFVKGPEGVVAIREDKGQDQDYAYLGCSDQGCPSTSFGSISYLDLSLEGRRR